MFAADGTKIRELWAGEHINPGTLNLAVNLPDEGIPLLPGETIGIWLYISSRYTCSMCVEDNITFYYWY